MDVQWASIRGLVAGSADSGETALPQIQNNSPLRPTVPITQPTRRGSSAIWVNVGTLNYNAIRLEREDRVAPATKNTQIYP